jgi:hypothetical protein
MGMLHRVTLHLHDYSADIRLELVVVSLQGIQPRGQVGAPFLKDRLATIGGEAIVVEAENVTY